MNRFNRLMLAAVGVGLGLVFATQSVFGQTKTITITVDNPRPMAAAVEMIEGLSGIPINYEDMPVYYATDLVDVTDTARTPIPNGRRIFVARGGQLSVPAIVDATTGKLDGTQGVETALAAVIAAYNSSGLPGGFDYEFYNGVFFVKPVRYRDANGAIQPMKSIFSTLITLPEEKRKTYLTLRLITSQVAEATGFDVGPVGFAGGGEMTLGAQNEPADHVIARYLAGGNGATVTPVGANGDVGFSYQLLCDRNVRVAYFLNVRRVDSSPRWKLPPNMPYSPPPRSVETGGRRR